jgi:hypothetical protein
MLKVLIAALATTGVLCLNAAPALAEFESKNSGSNGAGEVYEAKLEAGGAVASCQALETGNSTAGWQVTHEGKAQSKGPGLLIKITNWGSCEVVSPIKGVVKASACELEVEQPSSEIKLVGKVVKTCSFEGPLGCVIKMEPKNNSSLKATEDAGEGEADESTILMPAITNLATSVSSACELAGIKGSAEAKLVGVSEFLQVRPATVSEFAAGAEKLKLAANGNETLVTFIRKTGTAGSKVKIKDNGGLVQTIENGTGSFSTSPAGRLRECEANWEFEPSKTCNFILTRNGRGDITFTILTRVGGQWASAGITVRAP